MNLEHLKSLKWADILIFTLFDPRAMFRHIRDTSFSIYPTFLIPAMVTISEIVVLYLLKSSHSLAYYSFTYGWILNFIFLSVTVIITASLIDMAGQFAGFKGSGKRLIALVNLSLFPKIFLLPFVYIFSVIGFAPVFFYCLISFGLFIWSAFIAVLGISEMHGAGFGKSLLVYVFPFLFFLITGFFTFLLSLIGFFQLVFRAVS